MAAKSGVSVSVKGGKKLGIALAAIAAKVTRGGTLKMGFLAGKTYPGVLAGPGQKQRGPLAVAQVAFWNEFGTKRAPARPAFRTTVATNSADWGITLGKAVVYYKYDGEKALKAVGQTMRDDLEATIIRWSAPPNAPFTVKRKGFNKPLVHTGFMSTSPDFVVS